MCSLPFLIHRISCDVSPFTAAIFIHVFMGLALCPGKRIWQGTCEMSPNESQLGLWSLEEALVWLLGSLKTTGEEQAEQAVVPVTVMRINQTA